MKQMKRTFYANGTTANDNGNDCKIKKYERPQNWDGTEQNIYETNLTMYAKSDQPEI